MLSGRRLDVLTRLADELGARAVTADLSQFALMSSASWPILRPAVDILIANAALPATGHLLELSQAQIDTMLEVNLNAPIAAGSGAGAGEGVARPRANRADLVAFR